jgi:hypothetical protein
MPNHIFAFFPLLPKWCQLRVPTKLPSGRRNSTTTRKMSRNFDTAWKNIGRIIAASTVPNERQLPRLVIRGHGIVPVETALSFFFFGVSSLFRAECETFLALLTNLGGIEARKRRHSTSWTLVWRQIGSTADPGSNARTLEERLRSPTPE